MLQWLWGSEEGCIKPLQSEGGSREGTKSMDSSYEGTVFFFGKDNKIFQNICFFHEFKPEIRNSLPILDWTFLYQFSKYWSTNPLSFLVYFILDDVFPLQSFSGRFQPHLTKLQHSFSLSSWPRTEDALIGQRTRKAARRGDKRRMKGGRKGQFLSVVMPFWIC